MQLWKILAVTGAAALSPVMADARPETYRCALSGQGGALDVAFTMDPAQFAAPISAGEPPRRQIATGMLGATAFRAEAILTRTGARGFWWEDGAALLIRQADGTARLTFANARFDGVCRPAPG